MPANKLFVLTLISALCTSVLRAEDEKPKKPWKNVTEASYVSARGNSEAQTAAGKNTFTYDWAKTTLELIASGLGSKSEGSTTAEQYFASEKVSHKVTDRNYLFEQYRWDKDRFAGVRDRHDVNVGVGRELIKTPLDLFIGELGGGYISEDRINEDKNEFGTGRVYGKYTRTISPTASFSQDAEYLHNMEDSDDFRAKTETSLIATLTLNLSLKVSYVWKHVGVPPAGFERNDTISTVGIVATY